MQLLARAACFMTAAMLESDDVRQRSLAETAVDAMIQIVQQRAGSELISSAMAETVQGEVMALVRDRLFDIAKTVAPTLARLTDEAEIAVAWCAALVASSPVKH